MRNYIILISIVLMGLSINIIVLFIMVLGVKNEVRIAMQLAQTKQNEFSIPKIVETSGSGISSSSAEITCDNCMEEINKLKQLITVITTTPTSAAFSIKPLTSNNYPRELFIPLGTGKTKLNDWEDISGMSVTINTQSYPTIKSTTFEITLRIPTGTGKVFARLYNKTANHPVWYSEVSSEGAAAQLVISPKITLDSGENIYQVQMKNSLSTESYADVSRIKLNLE